jgi:7-carboxy-7-deazaguanine synthase
VKTYAIKEMFLTIQGEGYWSGQRAVFLRFAGCNVWTGRDEDRERDKAAGCCAAWCDTHFRGTNGQMGGHLTAAEITARVKTLWSSSRVRSAFVPGDVPGGGDPFVVCTGGEPSLQLDGPLVGALRGAGCWLSVETNGSHELPHGIDWVTLSPKPPMMVVARSYNEVKVVYPAVDPLPWAKYGEYLFISPLDQAPLIGLRKSGAPEAVGERIAMTVMPAYDEALAFVMAHPEWRLSLQTHKILGVP